ncbi:hypothetical protein NQ315_002419 [Exocentrus adspersus]|uniref:Iron-binding zinc finger CDGSH type domain-containing protein n=1 Tax=Exocentrus adspersus TaxID=1586481 RepID=A0AAV8VTG0_9CUCU|nr:hypothetical protein NQ315_002419 [Exocentrus adspersus]
MALRINNACQRVQQKLNVALYSSAKSTPPQIPKNTLEKFITGHKQKDNGFVYDKKPFKITLEAGKRYGWCLCGRSKTQPFCDGTHRHPQLNITLRPVIFAVEETKDYWLCNCKHTNNRPFCDGTHKSQVVQEATSIIRQ